MVTISQDSNYNSENSGAINSINWLERETLNLRRVLHVPKHVLNDEFHSLIEVFYLST